MEDILKSYKERLIKIGARNRSLSCKKLSLKNGFDIQKIENINKEELESWLINRTQNKFTLIIDPYKDSSNELKIAKETLDKEKEVELQKLYDKNLDDEEVKIKEDEIKEKFKKKLDEQEEKIQKKLEKQLGYIHNIKTLSKEIKNIKKETGRDELYIGYPFIEGAFKDNTFVRAPLFLFPVLVNINGSTVNLENSIDSPILLNKVFILAHSKCNESKPLNIETKYEKLSENFIDETLEELTKNDIYITNDNNSFEKFKDYTQKNMPLYNMGTLFLKRYTVLGQFPISNSIYTDYENLEGKDKGKQLEDLLYARNDYRGEEYEPEEHGKLSFSEKDLYLVSNLDYSQEKAVKKASESKNLVIYGPPGTGKSQTIVNIISDALAKDKRILMVSQKKAALDVIYNRLGNLNHKAIIVHDANKDKKLFYEKVKNELENINIDENNLIDDINIKAEQIDKGIKELEDIAKTLDEVRPFGISLQQMYAKTNAITSKEDNRYESFLEFRKNNIFKNYKYEELKNAVENINKEKINAFLNYEKMKLKNPFIEDVNPKMNFMDIDEFSRNIGAIRLTIKSITDKKYGNEEAYKMIMDKMKENNFTISEVTLIENSKNMNKNNNGYLLESLNNGKWWSISYWKDYSKNKKQENENKKLYELKEKELEDKILSLYREISMAFDEIKIVKKALNEHAYNIVLQELLNGEDLTKYFEDIISALKFIEDYRNDLEINLSFSKLEKDILKHCYSINKDNIKKQLENLVEFVILDHISDIEKEANVEESIKNIEKFNETVKSIKSNIQTKKDLTGRYILNKWNNNIKTIATDKNYKDFKHQANKKKMLYPIRKYIELYDELLLDMFPCFLLSPETVSEILPLKKGMFDTVIFDEASQMYIESAIPSIYRANKVIVAGDDKQLRPSSTFSSRYVDEVEDDEEDREKIAALEEESLLDLAKINFQSVHLTYHYRSQSEELINFSNYAFYGGRLKIAPNVNSNSDYGVPIERIKIANGLWENNENIEEANKVVELVAKLFKERKNKDTIGIITFNKKQQDLIEDLLEHRAQDDNEFKKAYIEEIDRIENDEDISLFVKNIENVQGDERDIIIFSTAYAKNVNNRLSSNFGTLNQDGGENRLNVAVSRAKKKIYVVTSIEPEELSVDNSKNNGPKLLKKYLQYVRAVSNEDKKEQQIILNSLVDSSINSSEIIHDSDFEAEVYDELVKRGYEVHTQVGVSGYRIDLAIYDREKSRYILGIECDGAAFHSSKSARERDIHRQNYLESRGWTIHRIWSKHWWRNPKAEIDKIDRILKEYNKENYNMLFDLVDN